MVTRRKNLKGKTPYEKLEEKSPEDLERAAKIYELFYDREPEDDLIIEVEWPDDQIVVGDASAIGYRCDKWNEPGDDRDYIHRHDKPYPLVIMQRPKIHGGDDFFKELSSEEGYDDPIPAPESPIFAQLGHALDLEYIRDGQIEMIDWKEGELPILAADLYRNILVIQPVDGGYPVLVFGPSMRITSRGIEY